MRAFLRFVCAFLFCVCFRRSKEGACLFVKEFEAENSQCVDVVLSMCVEGVVELLQRPFVVVDAPLLVEVSLLLRSHVPASEKPGSKSEFCLRFKLRTCKTKWILWTIPGSSMILRQQAALGYHPFPVIL